MTTLQAGDQSDLVQRLQTALIGLGYDCGPDGASGTFDEATQSAVSAFQHSRGLPATGIADPETIAAMDLDPETLEDLIEIDDTPVPGGGSSIAVEDGDNIYLDPPVRLWPQYDARWAHERIGGPRTGRMLDWVTNGCNASSAAMILRWFAEDCTAGRIDFPVKPGSTIDEGWYGLRLGESFWPNADPPGKFELTPQGRIHFRKLYSVAAHYLQTGELQRNERGDVVDPSSPQAFYVIRRPASGWMSLIRALLASGPVLVGIGAPAAHFVVAHGIKDGGLLIADPGGVLFQAHGGGRGEVENWSGKDGYLDARTDPDAVRLPAHEQWPGGQAPGQERDERSYHLISGQFLDDMLARLISVTSLTYPDGANLG